MFFVWLIILLIYGAAQGFAAIPALCWWLLLPFFLQDKFDIEKGWR